MCRILGRVLFLMLRAFSPRHQETSKKAVTMLSRGRQFVRLTLLSASLFLAVSAAPKTSAPAINCPAAANPADSQAMYRPEVRLRKLHLVRPDLIPYPIAYEVYC